MSLFHWVKKSEVTRIDIADDEPKETKFRMKWRRYEVHRDDSQIPKDFSACLCRARSTFMLSLYFM